MALRVPELDEDLVATLAELAEQLDGARSDPDGLVQRFNALAGSRLMFEDFQGVYGAEEHRDFVVRVRLLALADARPHWTREDVVQAVAAVLADTTDQQRLAYTDGVLRATYGETGFMDALFWPEEVFGEDIEPTAEQIADLVLGKR
jgi:hypothetical protein